MSGTGLWVHKPSGIPKYRIGFYKPNHILDLFVMSDDVAR